MLEKPSQEPLGERVPAKQKRVPGLHVSEIETSDYLFQKLFRADTLHSDSVNLSECLIVSFIFKKYILLRTLCMPD